MYITQPQSLIIIHFIGPAVLVGFGDCPTCNLLVGVTSGGDECGPKATAEQNNGERESFYVDVFRYADWIKDKMNSGMQREFCTFNVEDK